MTRKLKITIETDECANYGLSPNMVYLRLRQEYYRNQCDKNNCNFWMLETTCDESARQLYAQIKNRPVNVKSLILTYQDAENVFTLFKQFADVWVKNYVRGKKEGGNE